MSGRNSNGINHLTFHLISQNLSFFSSQAKNYYLIVKNLRTLTLTWPWKIGSHDKLLGISSSGLLLVFKKLTEYLCVVSIVLHAEDTKGNKYSIFWSTGEAGCGNLDFILQVTDKCRSGFEQEHSGDRVGKRSEGGKTGNRETSLGSYSNGLQGRCRK